MIRQTVLALTALALLSGCAAGPTAESLKQYSPTDGAQVTSDTVKVRGLLLVATSEESADLIATIVNSGSESDALASIVVNGQPVTITAESLDLETDKPLIFGGESATATGSVALNGVKAGQLVAVELRFVRAGLIETTALVREASLEFAPAS